MDSARIRPFYLTISMSETPSASTSKSKAISSLARKPSDVTRQGTQKLKFVPTLPARRNSVKTEPLAESLPPPPPSTPSNDRAHGRGQANGRGRGRGRGAPKASVEMVASGPFALGPALAATSSRRVTQFSAPIPTPTKIGSSSLGAGLSQTAAPNIKTEERIGKSEKLEKDGDEVYSDPDDGVEIIDMENIRQMDWMAPDSLRKERLAPEMKTEEDRVAEKVKTANTEEFDENDDVQELYTMMDDLGRLNENQHLADDPRRLYFLQFPSPFPTFTSPPSLNEDTMEIEATTAPAYKKVTFATDVKSEPEAQQSTSSRSTSIANEAKKELDGMIGHLEVYRSGARKIRLANGILLDVNAATQASFLEQVVHLDLPENKLAVLGEIYKRYVVSPDVDALLSAMDARDQDGRMLEGEEGLIRMDAD
ncbi:hypothetical protein D9757_001643 [Collybiopsis confluens]|uniref:DNA-directed RNA polymerase III subunit RPC4 n=1 Tax=Collybiopsis confluens TaxID=2823264 RepID=A0A8H5MFB6_9AGAR|nr:hypothetical protein D9757_001643 [Collybiopsis confluens]